MSLTTFQNGSSLGDLEGLLPSVVPSSASSGISGIQGVHCFDVHGRVISRGVHYVPGPDACVHCVCDLGGPQLCRAILCGQPPEKRNCKPTRVGTSCCEFICPDEDWLSNGISPSSMDMGVVVPKIIITAILSLLSISLLFFLFNRLRQRGRMNDNAEPRRLGRGIYDDCDDTRSLDYAIHDFGRNAAGFGYPPQYMAWWRKPFIPPTGEAPPPYEEAITSGSIPLSTLPLPSSQQHDTAQFSTKPNQNVVLEKPTDKRPELGTAVCNQLPHGIQMTSTQPSSAEAGPSSNGQPMQEDINQSRCASTGSPAQHTLLPSYSEVIRAGPSNRHSLFRRSLTLPRKANLIVNPRQECGERTAAYQRYSLPPDTLSWNTSSSSSPSPTTPSSPILERHDSSSPTSSASSAN